MTMDQWLLIIKIKESNIAWQKKQTFISFFFEISKPTRIGAVSSIIKEKIAQQALAFPAFRALKNKNGIASNKETSSIFYLSLY
jgi:hypothetical protein